MKNPSAGLANPISLNPVEGNDGLVQVIVETPKGQQEQIQLRSRAKGLCPQPDFAQEAVSSELAMWH